MYVNTSPVVACLCIAVVCRLWCYSFLKCKPQDCPLQFKFYLYIVEIKNKPWMRTRQLKCYDRPIVKFLDQS